MRRHLPWLALLVACGEAARPAAPPVAIRTPVVHDVARTPVTAAAPTIAAARGAHGDVIRAIAVTADGSAAVTAAGGGLRVWPALDASEHPFAIAAPSVSGLAIAHDGDGFVLALRDEANAVELVRVSRAGAIGGRVRLPGEAALDVQLVAAHALVLRADHRLEIYDHAGALRGTLVPDPAARIRSLVTRGEHAIALVASGRSLRARRIDVTGATWGKASPPMQLDPAHAALSPDGKQIAATRASDEHPMLFDVASGKALRFVCGARKALGAGIVPLGFVGDDLLACSVADVVTWYDTARRAPVHSPNAPVPLGGAVVTTEHALITTHAEHLVLSSPQGVQYLGYHARDPGAIRETTTGLAAVKVGAVAVVDEALGTRALAADLPTRTWVNFAPLDERHVLVATDAGPTNDPWGGAYRLALYDAKSRTVIQDLPIEPRELSLVYDPRTRLLLSSDRERRVVMRFDAVAQRFADPMPIELPDGAFEAVLVDPALAGGSVVLASRQHADRVEVFEVRASDLATGGVAKPARSYEVRGLFVAGDRAGRVYVAPGGDDVHVYRGARRVAVLRGAAPLTIVPSPDGAHVAARGNHHVALYAADGSERWNVPAWNVQELHWDPGGRLLAQFSDALGELELATGVWVRRQCGWDLRLSPEPPPAARADAALCDMAP